MSHAAVVLPPIVTKSGADCVTEGPGVDGKDGKAMTLDVKARTLGYQLPHAEAEIQRIEELQRARRDAFMRRRQQRPLEQSTGVANWLLSRHGDAPLEDLALAASPIAVRSVLLPQPGLAGSAPTDSLPVNLATATGEMASSMNAMERLMLSDAPGGLEGSLSAKSRHVEQQDDGIGMSRYQVRGDLLRWIQQVEATNERLIADAGDFSSREEAALHAALEHHVSKAVTKHAARDELVMKQSVHSLCEMMENMTRRTFSVPDDVPLREQLEAFELQLQELYTKAIKSGGLVFGNQVVSAEIATSSGKKVESEGEIRKRQLAVGVAAAAQSQHLMLSQVQLDQVLNAMYQQRQPANKREKGRLERQLVQSMIREDNVTSSLRRRNEQLTEEIETLQEGMQKLLEERQRLKALVTPSLVPIPTSQGGGNRVDDIQTTNEMIQAMAEVLAKKHIRENQARLDELESGLKSTKAELESLQHAHTQVTSERDTLRERLDDLEMQRARQEELKRQQEEERKRLFGGMKSDQQYYLSTIHRILLYSASTVGELVLCLGDADSAAQSPHAVPWDGVLKVVDKWIAQCSFAFHFSEAAKCTAAQVRETVSNRASAAPDARGFIGPDGVPSELNRQLVNELAQKLDGALGEAKSKFRELRYMRSLLWYLIHCFEAMLNGTYSDEIHGKRSFRNPAATASAGNESTLSHAADTSEIPVENDPFPPATVVSLDVDYGYAWSEEVQALDRLFTGLRSRLVTSAETLQGEVNTAVLKALEVANDQLRQSSIVEGTSKTDRDGPSMMPPALPSHPQITKLDVESMVSAISQLPVVSSKDVRLAQSMDDHQRLPTGARAVDVATVLLLQIKEAKGHFSGSEGPASIKSQSPLFHEGDRQPAHANVASKKSSHSSLKRR